MLLINNLINHKKATVAANWLAVTVAALSLGLFMVGPFGWYGLTVFLLILLGIKEKNLKYQLLATILLVGCGFITIFSLGAYILLMALLLIMSMALQRSSLFTEIINFIVIGFLLIMLSSIPIGLLINFEYLPETVFGITALLMIIEGWRSRKLPFVALGLNTILATIMLYPKGAVRYMWVEVLIGFIIMVIIWKQRHRESPQNN